MDMGYETYQKILAEAMEELGVESGIKIGRREESFVHDCTIETDQPALIPDDYIDIAAEKIRIYKQLDALTDEREIDRLGRQISDRFGPLPREVQNLLNVVKIRNLGSLTGFEKIIIKNGMQIMFFVNNPMSAYYTGDVFKKVLGRVNENSSLFKLNQDNGKLRTVSRGVNSLESALAILKKFE